VAYSISLDAEMIGKV